MKVLAIILLSFVWESYSIQDHELLDQWNRFQMKYGKTYRSPVEVRKRLTIFNDNLENINAHNALFRKGETTFTKGINKFADWTEDEFMQYVNQGLTEEPIQTSGKVFRKTEGFQIPEYVDWRGKGAVSGVKDQGHCSACWAFSATGTLESQLLIYKNENVSLSEQDLIDCTVWNMGCMGGWPHRALLVVQQSGVESEADYVYTGIWNQCKSDPSKIVTKISGYESLQEDEEALQEVVATKGPVSICLYASTNFHLYSAGILKEENCPQTTFNHAVLVVGYGSENGQDYYIVKNSWGLDWGESGYIRLARNNDNMCGLASKAVIPIL